MSAIAGITQAAEIGAPLLVELVKLIKGRKVTEEEAKAALRALLEEPPRDLQLDSAALAAIAAGGKLSTVPPPPVSSLVLDAAERLASDLRARGLSAVDAAELSEVTASKLREQAIKELQEGAI